MNNKELIERCVDLDTDRYPSGRADARLREFGVPICAPIGPLGALDGNVDQMASDYELPSEAVEAALVYNRCNKEYMDARLLLNSAKGLDNPHVDQGASLRIAPFPRASGHRAAAKR